MTHKTSQDVRIRIVNRKGCKQSESEGSGVTARSQRLFTAKSSYVRHYDAVSEIMFELRVLRAFVVIRKVLTWHYNSRSPAAITIGPIR